MGWAWRATQLFGSLSITVANVCATVIAWDDTKFPHMMLSDYVAHDRAAPIVEVWWVVYILLHLPFELRLLYRVNVERSDRSAAADRAAVAWNWTFVALVFGWFSMVGCLRWDIRRHPSTHSLMGAIYGAGWLCAQGVRYVSCDAHRVALGLARAPRASRLRGALCACEIAVAPLIGAGMLLPLRLCPDALSWACIWAEHVFMIHGRSLLSSISYYADFEHLDRANAPPRMKRVKSATRVANDVRTFRAALETTKSAVKTRIESRPDGSARRRLTVGFRSTMLRGL